MKEEIFNIPTYVICDSNTDDRSVIEHEFSEHAEFELHVKNIDGDNVESNIWLELRRIIKQIDANADDDIIIICTGRHRFSENYDYNTLIDGIITGAALGAHIIFGGCEDILDMVHVKDNLFWTNKIFESEFVIMFRPAFDAILKSRRRKNETWISVISRAISNKFIVFPFISKISKCESQDNDNIDERKIRKISEEKFMTYKRIVRKYNLR